MSTFDKARSQFLHALQAEGRSSETIKWYRGHLNRFGRKCNGDWRKTDVIRDFLAAQRAAVTLPSLHAYYRVLRAFYGWCEREGLLCNENPMHSIRPPAQLDNQPKAIKLETFLELVAAAEAEGSHKILAAVLLLADTGARAGEICNLRREDINDGVILIRCAKNHRQRFVFIKSVTQDAVNVWLEHHNYAWLFPGNPPANPMRPRSLHQLITRFARKHGIEGRVNPHAFRHFLAMEWVRNGGDVFRLADYLGHSNLSTTKRYLRWTVDDLRTVHEDVSPINRLKR